MCQYALLLRKQHDRVPPNLLLTFQLGKYMQIKCFLKNLEISLYYGQTFEKIGFTFLYKNHANDFDKMWALSSP